MGLFLSKPLRYFEQIWNSYFGNSKMRHLQQQLHKSALPQSITTLDKLRESALPQEFSFPKPIMKYIRDNASLKIYQKLVKSCKYFFVINPVVVIQNLDYSYKHGWEYCKKEKCNRTIGCKHNRLEAFGRKIWVSKSFSAYVEYYKSERVSQFIPKIYQYDAEDLLLSNQILSFDELKFLSTGVKECTLYCNIIYYDTTIPYENGEQVPMENIIQLFSGAKKLSIMYDEDEEDYDNPCKSYDDLIKACKRIKEVELQRLPHDFDIPKFYQCLKRSKNRTCSFKITTRYAEKRPLDQITVEILEMISFDFLPPVIEYSGHDRTKLEKIKEIQSRLAFFRR